MQIGCQVGGNIKEEEIMACSDCGEDFSMLPDEAESLEKHGRCIACQFIHELAKRIERMRDNGQE